MFLKQESSEMDALEKNQIWQWRIFKIAIKIDRYKKLIFLNFPVWLNIIHSYIYTVS